MSKKSKLKKQKEKQVQMKKLADLEELEEKEAAKHKESKGAKKMRRRAKRGYSEALLIIPKLIMLAAYLWSGFFFGGVLAVGVMNGSVYVAHTELAPRWVAYCTIAGAGLILLGTVLAFIKKYPASFVSVLAGNAVFMKAVRYIMDVIKRYKDTVAYDPDLSDMDKTYAIRYYPILITLLMSAIITAVWIIKTVRRARRKKKEMDNAPVESIVGDE